MSNVVSINYNRCSISEFKEALQNALKAQESNAWVIAEIVAHAKDPVIEEGWTWKEWVEDEVGWHRSTADKYLQIHDCLAHSGRDLIENGCSFNTLQLLSKTSLPSAVRERIVSKLLGKKPPSPAEVKQIINDAIPKGIALPEPVEFHYPPFAVRLNEMLHDEFMSPEKAARLFGMSIKAHLDDIKIITRHWKQKYHPDKGGSKEEYQKICRAEEVFTASQNEKEVAA